MAQQHPKIKNEKGLEIAAILHQIDGNKPLIIISHGFGGTKEDWIPTLRLLEKQGYNALAFDFTNNIGKSGGAMENFTVSSAIADVGAVVEFAKERFPKIILMGHSLGAAISLLFAARHDKIGAIVSSASGLNIAALAESLAKGQGFDLDAWKEQGKIPLDLIIPGKELKYDFYLDAKGIDLLSEIAKIKCPVLVIHGEKDMLVKPYAAKQIHANIGSADKSLAFIKDADHNYSGKEKDFLSSVLNWLDQRFK